jgi:hypothetical protein
MSRTLSSCRRVTSTTARTSSSAGKKSRCETKESTEAPPAPVLIDGEAIAAHVAAIPRLLDLADVDPREWASLIGSLERARFEGTGVRLTRVITSRMGEFVSHFFEFLWDNIGRLEKLDCSDRICSFFGPKRSAVE